MNLSAFTDEKTFITVIRRPGVPASLTTVSNQIGYGGPLLEPYPNWNWAELGDCDGITSVFRVAVSFMELFRNCRLFLHTYIV